MWSRWCWLPLLIVVLSAVMASPVLGEPCALPLETELDRIDPAPAAHWSRQEKWVWTRVLVGEVADFDQLYCVELDPKESNDAWADARPRRLSERFLLDVLGVPRFVNAVSTRGLRIAGARIDSEVDLSGLQFSRRFSLDRTRVEESVSLAGAKLGDSVSFDSSFFAKALDMTGAEIARDMFARHATLKSNVNLPRAVVGGMLDVTGSTFHGKLDMEGSEIGQNLILSDGAYFEGELYAPFSKIGGVVQTNDSLFLGTISFESAEIEEHLLLRFGAKFEGIVKLTDAKIDGVVDMTGGIFEKDIYIFNAKIGRITLGAALRNGLNGDVLPSVLRTKISQRLILEGAIIDHDIYVGQLVLLEGAIIDHDIYVGPLVLWGSSALLNLENASAGVILDTAGPDSWPGNLALDGFTYERLGSFGANHSKEWYTGWLDRDPDFSPQPYQQMAKAFREIGDYEMADYLLYAGRERERSQVTGPRWIGLSLLKITIGYGLGGGYFLALAWVAGLTLVGSIVLWTSGTAAEEHGCYWCLWASFDEILPLVELDKGHATFVNETLVGRRLTYFYVHRIAGYVLGSFIIAGLAGLTQGL